MEYYERPIVCYCEDSLQVRTYLFDYDDDHYFCEIRSDWWDSGYLYLLFCALVFSL